MSETMARPRKITGLNKLFEEIERSTLASQRNKKPKLIWFKSNSILDYFKKQFHQHNTCFFVDVLRDIPNAKYFLCHRYLDQMNHDILKCCVSLQKEIDAPVIYFANEYERRNRPVWLSELYDEIELNVRSAIILNHMFTGNYLQDNIGHEVINLFLDDNAQHYVYLCRDGKFNRDDVFVEYVVQVYRPVNTKHTLQILNIASDVTPYSAKMSAMYGGHKVEEIFRFNNSQQDVCATFCSGSTLVPAQPVYLWTADESKEDDKMGEVINGINPSRQLHEYIYEELDEFGCSKKMTNYSRLKHLIEYGIDVCNEENLSKVDINIDTSTSFAEIYGILGRELPFSDAFKYFILKYPDSFLKFMVKSGYVDFENEHVKDVYREFQHMDIVVVCDKHWVVIENKIFSDINGKKGKQLSDYSKKIVDISQENKIQFVKMLLLPDHNKLSIKDDDWSVVKYSEVYRFIESEYLGESNTEINEFLKALKPHTEIDFNYSLMHKRFVRAISKC